MDMGDSDDNVYEEIMQVGLRACMCACDEVRVSVRVDVRARLGGREDARAGEHSCMCV